MATSKTKTVKFEVGQLVMFSGNRVGKVSRIAKNGAIYVTVLGETTVVDQPSEELRVKKADLQLIEESEEIVTQQSSAAPMGWDKIEAGHEVETVEAKANTEEKGGSANSPVQQAAVDSAGESIQSTFGFPTEESQSGALADATYALRELTFSVTRHSILTAFIDVALNKNIPDYPHKVASNIKNLMAAAFDPVHDSVGYARINTWMEAALALVVKNKDRVAKMLNQPIEAAPIKMDRVTKLGMWIDNMMNREGHKVNDLTAAHDSCYMYDALGKKLEACTFVVVEVVTPSSAGRAKVKVIKDPMGYYTKHLTAQSAISARQQHGKRVHRKSPDWYIYCGIVPILKTGLSMQAAIEDTLANVIGSLK